MSQGSGAAPRTQPTPLWAIFPGSKRKAGWAGSFNCPVPDEADGLAAVFGEVLAGFRDAVVIQGADQGQACVSGGRQDLRAAAVSDSALVFTEGHVAHTEEPVLDTPMRQAHLEQLPGIGPLATETGDGVDRLDALLTVELPLSPDPTHLSDARPPKVAGQGSRGLQSPRLGPAVRLDRLLGYVYLSSPALLLEGGKPAP